MTDTPFTSWAMAVTGATTTRTLPNRLVDTINVRDFGAVGDGSTDDTTAINAAFTKAWASGTTSGGNSKGAIVFFPPGAYKVTSTLDMSAGGSSSVSIVGSGMYNTTIIGNINGFILDKPDGTGAVVQSIRDLQIVNQNTTLGSGALRFGFVSSANLENLYLQGIIGLDAGADQFQSRYANIAVSANFENQIPGSIGIVACDATFVGCNVLGYDTGYLAGGTTSGANAGAPGTNFIGCRAEVCTTGWNLGKNILGNTSSAGVTMVGCQSERCYNTIVCTSVAPLSIIGGSFTGTVGPGHYFHLSDGGSLTWSGGTATLTIPANQPSLDSYGWTSGTREVVIEGAETATLTVTNAVWSGGTSTFTTSNPLTDVGWSSGTRQIIINGIAPAAFGGSNLTGTRTGTNTFTVSMSNPGSSYTGGGTISLYPGYNTWPGHITATRTGTRTFTYSIADPGGSNTNTWADWSFRQQTGIKFLNAQFGLVSGVALGFNDLEVAGLDFSSLDGGLITVQGTYSSVSLPAGARKAGVIFENPVIPQSMVFADLPGQAGVWLNAVIGGAKEGMIYDITDANTATWGATAGGGGSNHVQVRYNGTNWTVVGK